MEARLFAEGTIPEYTTPEWYEQRERAPHLEQFPHIARLHRAAEYVREAQALSSEAVSVVDLGAGDGGFLTLLDGVKAWGYDLQPSNVEGAAERGVDVRLGNVLTDDIEWGDIAVATEVIEHLIDPHGFVKEVASRCRFLVASSPAFETAESHYAFHLWAWDKKGYCDLMEQGGFQFVFHDFAGEFQVVLAFR